MNTSANLNTSTDLNTGTHTPRIHTRRIFLSLALWLLQALLAAVFLAHGGLLLTPPAEIATVMNAQFPRAFWVFLGVAEVLAALGLILPGVTRILPRLIVWACYGLMIVMVSATVLHVGRGETSSAMTTAILLVLITLVAYGRSRVRPIATRRAAARR
jgi:uncharacterized membrane protein YphA (DoxX/SURF4 family)